MRGKLIVLVSLSLSMLGYQNCASPKFADASGGASLGKVAGSESEFGNGDGRIPADGDDDDGLGSIPLAEFLEMIAKVPAQAADVAEKNRCCISHGGGHGIDLCMAGDKSALLKFWPIEVRGDSICVPASTVQANAALFTGAVVGRCVNR